MWDLPGQDQAVAALARATANNDLGHAWAFVGPRGVGQEHAARVFAALVNEVQPGTPTWDRFMRGTHPAITTFAPVGAHHLKGEVNDTWLKAAYQTLMEGSIKVLYIREADRMNPDAANAFLKTLEEPPAGTIWILEIANSQAVPDTIMSRCRQVRFAPWPVAQLAAMIPDHPDQALVLALAEGAPDRLRTYQDPAALAEYREARTWVPDLLDRGPAMAMLATHRLSIAIKRRGEQIEQAEKDALAELSAAYERVPPNVQKSLETQFKRLVRAERVATIQDALDACSGYLRDVIAVATNPQAPLRNPDCRDRLIADAQRISIAAAVVISERIQRCRDALEVNAVWDLAVQAMLLEAHTACIVHPVR